MADPHILTKPSVSLVHRPSSLYFRLHYRGFTFRIDGFYAHNLSSPEATTLLQRTD